MIFQTADTLLSPAGSGERAIEICFQTTRAKESQRIFFLSGDVLRMASSMYITY